VFHSSCF